MSIEVKVPGFPESVADGTVVTWHKKAGEFVKRDENIVDIETDKVVFEVPAPEDGILQEILEAEGVTVVSGQLLARMDPANGKDRAADTPERKQTPTKEIQAEKTSGSNIEIFLTPSARKIITEHNLDASRIQPTGKEGRILKEDVIRFMEETSEQKVIQAEKQDKTPEKQAPGVTITESGQTVEYNEERPSKRVPMTRLRAKIAERLVEAQQTAAILTTFNEVNMKP
ncbi:MAG: E3 binding domain-containing protein, partial [Gammaproteobacteria bacterium]|nr:E3 binding domain-containing protein [Gammaproteobacteria bacterium]